MEVPATTTLQEVIIAAHFASPLPLTVMDLADWVRHFGQFSLVQQLPPAPHADVAAPGQAIPPFQVVEVAHHPLPRMLLRTPDGRFSVQLQHDRFAVGWTRTEPLGAPANYPGFQLFSEYWIQRLAEFDAWTGQRFRQVSAHRLIELTYSNVAPLLREGKMRRISEIFKFVQPGARALSMFNVSWLERVYDEPVPFRATVTATVGLGQGPTGEPGLVFNFIGLGKVAEGQESKQVLSDIHGKIRQIYESSIVTDGR